MWRPVTGPAAPNARPKEVAPSALLQRAVVARARSEQQLVDTVITARGAGLSWQRIGAILGTSAQAAQQRYGTVVEAAS
ncbi:MAG: hypothetical protein ABI862_12825 [Ilumatobacteraceae bacterium]